MIRVVFFGPVADRIGSNQLRADFHAGMTLQQLRDGLAAQHARAFEIVSMMAVNGEHVRDLALPLADNSEVAFMAKFSGG